MYILTGCDTVSYPYKRGKRRAYETAVDHLADLLSLCICSDPDKRLDIQKNVTSARHYMMSLYERGDFGGNLDALSVISLVTSKETCVAFHLPAFNLHLRRALHQLAIRKRAHMF